MKHFIAGLFLVSVAATSASAEDDLNRSIAERAASCWATPTAMRGVKLDVAFDVRFTGDGHVDSVRVVDFLPKTETSRRLALDFAGALKGCSPYATEGVRDMKISVSWPM